MAKAFCFWVPNPYGLCTTVRVAVRAANRTDAVRRIKAEGLRIKARQEQDSAFADDERVMVRTGRDTVWINMAEPGSDWMPISEFPRHVRES